MKKLLVIGLVSALAGATIHAARSQQETRSRRAAGPEPLAPVGLTKQLNQMPSPNVSGLGGQSIEPAALYLYSQPQPVSLRPVMP